MATKPKAPRKPAAPKVDYGALALAGLQCRKDTRAGSWSVLLDGRTLHDDGQFYGFTENARPAVFPTFAEAAKAAAEVMP